MTYTFNPTARNGFQINGSFAQTDVGADWTFSINISRVTGGTTDTADQTATFVSSGKVPFNEAQNEAAIVAKIQALVDVVFDKFLPTPATP